MTEKTNKQTYPKNIVEAVEYIRLKVMQYPSKHTTFDSVKCAEKLIELINDKENIAAKLEKLISATNYIMDTLDTILQHQNQPEAKEKHFTGCSSVL